MAALVLLALTLDERLARAINDAGFDSALRRKDTWLRSLSEILKTPGEWYYALALAALALLGSKRAGPAIFVFVAWILSAVNSLFKWIVGRERPARGGTFFGDAWDLEPFRGGLLGLFHQSNLSFPSGHATAAFAAACAFARVFPRWGWLTLIPATATAAERVLTNSHYLSEVTFGAILGYLCALILPLSRQSQTPPTPVTLTPPISTPTVSSPTYLSLVVPCYNEQESLPALLPAIENAFANLGQPWEAVLVDDGSKDNTPAMLAEARARLPWLRVLRLEPNSGQSAAFEAGFAAARGQLIATIDADLQNDPTEIPRLIPYLGQYDMVSGWRKKRNDPPIRLVQTRIANSIRNYISQETINDSASSLKVYKAHCLKGMNLWRGAHRFLPTLVKMRGYTCIEVPVSHQPRAAGISKYPFGSRVLRATIDLFAVRWMKSRHLRYTAREV
jgi:dolichol-phosphate mannosyltransferase